MDGSTPAPLFRMEGVSKRYGGVNALTNADLVLGIAFFFAWRSLKPPA